MQNDESEVARPVVEFICRWTKKSVLPWLIPSILCLPSALVMFWDLAYYTSRVISLDEIVSALYYCQLLSVESTVASIAVAVIVDNLEFGFETKLWMAMLIVVVHVIAAVFLIYGRSL